MSLLRYLRTVFVGLCLVVSLTVYAVDFTVQDLRGKPHHLADYQGKFVLVNFWATWCSPCLSEIPELNALHQSHKDLVIIAVAMQSGSSTQVGDFAVAHQMPYPIVMGTRAIAEKIRLSAQQTAEIEVLPTSYLFDPQGKLLSVQEGQISKKSLEVLMQSRNRSQ